MRQQEGGHYPDEEASEGHVFGPRIEEFYGDSTQFDADFQLLGVLVEMVGDLKGFLMG